MDFSYTKSETEFIDEVRTWLDDHVKGEFVDLQGKGLTGHEDVDPELQIAWEKELASGGWLGIDFPKSIGGRECSLVEQVLFHKTYVEARAPGRIPNMGVTLLGPTLMAFGSAEQQNRFVPSILAGEELWCQGYSEPDAGSDLANVNTKAERIGDQWVINGQKIWTSLAQFADWIFVVARTEKGSRKHKGLSYLLVPMRQEGVTIRPIIQITGGAEFNETFFDGAITDKDLVVGGEGNGWKVAMGTLSFERGASTLGQQVSFRQELDELVQEAKSNCKWDNPVIRQKITQSYMGLEILRYNQLRMLTALASDGVPGAEQSIGKLYWASWHRELGELWMLVKGASGMIATNGYAGDDGVAYTLDKEQRTFLYSRAHTIYGGSNEIQRNIIGERVLGLAKEPRQTD
ncbi:MAG: acyl-CoA dehydrogenase family protein [Acidimicrobiales bacterium]|jgi:alkylation response protein AidB-like acyl-CoA dehydrogenase|nr:acyl-CoA dehydrogenase family protein [Acidimicrobiales bacterium]MDP6298993.1 acyl-CoA dehydrogenase family protein [Acidimicrobiales bacterium]HJM28505.1 acyl-CoA dehydrogenase family protein [Acidimicrobiales bacterium]